MILQNLIEVDFHLKQLHGIQPESKQESNKDESDFDPLFLFLDSEQTNKDKKHSFLTIINSNCKFQLVFIWYVEPS